MKVFLSYRRRDDPNFAWRLRDRFAHHYGDDNVFFDIDSVFFGADFVETIRQMITDSDCVLVAIGPTWDPARLWSEEDYVRMEVLEAVNQGKLLIPVLNGATPIPAVDALPDQLRFLARRNAAIVQPDHFDRDVSALIKQIELQVTGHGGGGPGGREGPTSIRDELTRAHVAFTEDSGAVITGHTGPALSLAFGAAGTLASGGSDNTARLWDLTSGAESLRVTAKGGRVCGVALSHGEGELFTTSSDVAHAWAADRGRRRATFAGHSGSIWGLAVSPDSSLVATGSADNTAWVWDAATARRSRLLRGHTGWVTSVTFSPDGQLLATGSTDNTCRIWSTDTGRHILSLSGHTRSVTSVSFSPDQRSVVTASADGTARLWDLRTGREFRRLAGHRETVTSVAWVPGGDVVVTGGVDGSCRAWSTTAGRQLRAFLGHEGRVHAVAASCDGRTLASGGADGTIRLWALDV